MSKGDTNLLLFYSLDKNIECDLEIRSKLDILPSNSCHLFLYGLSVLYGIFFSNEKKHLRCCSFSLNFIKI